MTKRVIVACGGAVATSTIAAGKIRALCRKNGIPVEIVQVRISEIPSHLYGADLIVTTGRVKREFGVPLIVGTAFLSGIGVEQTEARILAQLKDK